MLSEIDIKDMYDEKDYHISDEQVKLSNLNKNKLFSFVGAKFPYILIDSDDFFAIIKDVNNMLYFNVPSYLLANVWYIKQ